MNKKLDREFVIPAPLGMKVLFVEGGRLHEGDSVLGVYSRVYDYGPDDDMLSAGATGYITSSGLSGLGSPSNFFGVIFPDGHVECHDMWFPTITSAESEIFSDREVSNAE